MTDKPTGEPKSNIDPDPSHLASWAIKAFSEKYSRANGGAEPGLLFESHILRNPLTGNFDDPDATSLFQQNINPFDESPSYQILREEYSSHFAAPVNKNAGAIIEIPKGTLGADGYKQYAEDLIQNKSFKEIEPRLALDFVAENFADMHDQERSDKLTAQEVLNYKQNCVNGDPIKEELLKWVLHTVDKGDGQQHYDRLDRLASIVGESGGVTLQGLTRAENEVRDEVNFQNVLPENAPDAPVSRDLLGAVRFMEDNASLLTTPVNPKAITQFALDRLAYNESVPAQKRQSAALIADQFPFLNESLGNGTKAIPLDTLDHVLDIQARFEGALSKRNEERQKTRSFWIDEK